MGKNYFIFAAALMALASCQTDDYLGENTGNAEGTTMGAIRFDGGTGKITRATSNSGTTAEMLDHQFKIYGVKATSENNKYTDVFKNYILWDATTNSTTTNTNGWEYVGNKGQTYGSGDKKPELENAQTIKFWDYSSDNYHFVAGSPVSAFTYSLDETTKDIKSATIIGLEGHIKSNMVDENGTWSAKTEPSPVYVAEPIIAKKSTGNNESDYQKPVKFTFVRQQSKVRVGIYETIPGYSISEIHFYAYDEGNNSGNARTRVESEEATGGGSSSTTTTTKTLKASTSKNIILTSKTENYFVGGNPKGTITYNWSGENAPSYTFSYSSDNTGNTGTEEQNADSYTLTQSQNWYGGELTSGVKATTSTESNVSNLYGTDQDMESTGYFTVLPTPSNTQASAILIKCNYTLKSEDNSGEEIKVTGATAAIPAAFSKWETNTQYTYLFKISQNTNGTTGKPDENDPAGLFPITFDALVKEIKESKEEGTITTVTTPSITTYQDGSVTADGIEYKTGTPITVRVTENTTGVVKNINKTSEGSTATEGAVEVYKYTNETTEADLQITSPTGSAFTSTVSDNVLTFTPDAEGYYAIQYLQSPSKTENGSTTPAVYVYKVVYVKTATTSTSK